MTENEIELMPSVIELRGERVVLDSVVAVSFGVSTSALNQAVSRSNAWKFRDHHRFQLTTEEVVLLRDQGVLPKPGRGGRRTLPWAFTQKGIVRLATVINSPRALDATDLIIDVFTEVANQIRGGASTISISEPSRLLPSPEQKQRVEGLRGKLLNNLDALLDQVIDPARNRTLGEELQKVGGNLIGNIQARLKQPELVNAKVEAEIELLLSQAREVMANAQLKQEEAEGVYLKNIQSKIDIVERMLDVTKKMEPDALIGWMGQFDLEMTEAKPSLTHIERHPTEE